MKDRENNAGTLGFVDLSELSPVEQWLSSWKRDVSTSGTLGARHVNDDSDLAGQFAMAAGSLLEAALKGSAMPVWMIPIPILFLYRHAVELYLKALLPKPALTHDLITLLHEASNQLKRDYGQSIEGTWIGDSILELSKYDFRSMGFRYLRDKSGSLFFSDEVEVDFVKLRDQMGKLCTALWRISMLEKPTSPPADVDK